MTATTILLTFIKNSSEKTAPTLNQSLSKSWIKPYHSITKICTSIIRKETNLNNKKQLSGIPGEFKQKTNPT